MSGDYSRFPFDPRRNYSGVLLQQGRVLLDQDGTRRVRLRAVASVLRWWICSAASCWATPDAFKIESDGRGGLTIGANHHVRFGPK